LVHRDQRTSQYKRQSVQRTAERKYPPAVLLHCCRPHRMIGFPLSISAEPSSTPYQTRPQRPNAHSYPSWHLLWHHGPTDDEPHSHAQNSWRRLDHRAMDACRCHCRHPRRHLAAFDGASADGGCLPRLWTASDSSARVGPWPSQCRNPLHVPSPPMPLGWLGSLRPRPSAPNDHRQQHQEHDSAAPRAVPHPAAG